MSPTELGSFCAHCQKEVIDFTRMSDKEVLAFFKKQSGRTCGRFRKDQVNRPLLYPPKRKYGPLLGGFLSLFAIASPFLGQATPPIPVEQTEVSPHPKLVLEIRDSETNMPLFAVDISSPHAHQMENWARAKKLYFPDGIPESEIRLEISAPGYESQTLILPPSAVGSGQVVKVEMTLSPLTFSIPHVLKGRVVAKKTGRPLKNVAVTIPDADIKVKTDLFGHFKIEITDPVLVRHGEIEFHTDGRYAQTLLIREMAPFERIILQKVSRWDDMGDVFLREDL